MTASGTQRGYGATDGNQSFNFNADVANYILNPSILYLLLMQV